MKLFLFALLCILTLLLIRALQAGSHRQSASRQRGRREPAPPASPDEIVDVRYEECTDPIRNVNEKEDSRDASAR